MAYGTQTRESAWGGDASSVPVSALSAETRAEFIKKTYAHLAMAIAALVGLELLAFGLMPEPAVNRVVEIMMGGRFNWLIVLGAFMAASYVAHKWAANGASVGQQYAGLALYVVAETIILFPLLAIAGFYANADLDSTTFGLVGTAALITLLLTAGITAFVFITGANFSFLGGFLSMAAIAAFGLIVASAIFGFSLGLVFIVAMIVLMCGFILYETSNVLHTYPVGFHVAAALALFASIATLFWYVLQLLMSLQSDD